MIDKVYMELPSGLLESLREMNERGEMESFAIDSTLDGVRQIFGATVIHPASIGGGITYLNANGTACRSRATYVPNSLYTSPANEQSDTQDTG